MQNKYSQSKQDHIKIGDQVGIVHFMGTKGFILTLFKVNRLVMFFELSERYFRFSFTPEKSW